jgi:hypothetical protein
MARRSEDFRFEIEDDGIYPTILHLVAVSYVNESTGLRGGGRRITAPQFTGDKMIYTNRIQPPNLVSSSRKNPPVSLAFSGIYLSKRERGKTLFEDEDFMRQASCGLILGISCDKSVVVILQTS